MNNVVFIVNIKNEYNPDRSSPYNYSIDSWKHWCKNNNFDLFVLEDRVYEKEIMNPNWHKLLVFDLLEHNEIDYDQILIVDADTIVHPDCPNFFDISEYKFCAVPNYGSYDWVIRGMEIYSKYVFEGFMFDWWEHFNSGFMIINKKHKSLFKEILDFYLNNQELLVGLQEKFGVGTDQPVINFFIQKNKVDLNLLPYKYNMMEMYMKEIVTHDLLFTKIGHVYHFNAGLPKVTDEREDLYWMRATYEHLYGSTI